jgi:hypothetical protein
MGQKSPGMAIEARMASAILISSSTTSREARIRLHVWSCVRGEKDQLPASDIYCRDDKRQHGLAQRARNAQARQIAMQPVSAQQPDRPARR